MSLPLWRLYIVFLTIVPDTSGFLISVKQIVVISSLVNEDIARTFFVVFAQSGKQASFNSKTGERA